MASIATLFLRALHYIYSAVVLWHFFWKRFTWTPPQPLQAARPQTPKHLAVVLVTDPSLSVVESEHCLVQSVRNAVGWCCAAGIEKLTVYEEHGKLLECSQNIRDIFGGDSDESSSESPIEYPLTPPPSDYSESRPISPLYGPQLNMHTVTIQISNQERKFPRDGCTLQKDDVDHNSQEKLTLCLASRESSKPAIASLAESLRKSRNDAKHTKIDALSLTEDTLDKLLESDDTLSSPDSMIVHPISPLHRNRTPLELHGYPPWHIRLTEIYHSRFQYPAPSINQMRTASHMAVALDEITFNQALDEFAAAEMRFGK